jgi:malonate decarboxylase alpha subunit
MDQARIHDLHMVQSVVALPDHLAVFEHGIANRLNFAYAGPQSRRLAELVAWYPATCRHIHAYL